jgi:hypothetical protein
MFCSPGLVFGGTRSGGSFFMFCAHDLIFGGTEGLGSRFHVLRVLTRFQRYRRRRVPFSCFTLLDSFSAVSRASALVFMFCAPVLVCRGTEGVRSRFHVLSSRTHFRQYRGRRLPFSWFVLPDTFSVVPRASDLIFSDTECIGSRFHVLRARTRFRRF